MSKPCTRGAVHAADKQPGEDDTERLINKVCACFAKQLETQFNEKLDKINDKLDKVTNMFDKLNKVVDCNQKAIVVLEKKCNQFEQLFRRNSLIFHGLSNDNGEDVLNIILSLINNVLKIPCLPVDIDNAYWMRQDAKKKTRPVRVTFMANIKRNAVFASKKLLKNSAVTIYEDLSKHQYNLFLEAKKKFGHRETWTTGGRVYVRKDNGKCLINGIEDL